MRPDRNPLALLMILLMACPALFTGPAVEAAIRKCDRRLLPKADTLSVEAAARAATHGELPDIKVEQSCITRTTTSVTLTRPNPTDSGSRREQWRMSCEREPSTWYKRGGWRCGVAWLARDMDAKAAFLGGESTLFISFDSTLSFETAEGLARRALVLFEEPMPQPCRPAIERDWKEVRELELHGADPTTLNVVIETERRVLRVRPLGWFSGLGFEFQTDAVADPAHAPACWVQQVIVD
jgi:hypothetical protein